MDVLKDLAERMGFPPMSPEAEAAARALCDELVPADQLPNMAAVVRRSIEGWPNGR